MSPAEQFLAGVTLRQWLERDGGLVATVRDALLEVLPSSFTPGFTTGNVDHGLPFVIHQPSALGFYVVFGSRCMFGVSAEERAASRGRGDDEDDLDGGAPLEASPPGPLVDVDVAPFLVSERILDLAWVERLGVRAPVRGRSPAAVDRSLADHGLRLPTEVELFLCYRLESLRACPELPELLWEGVASEFSPSTPGRRTPARPDELRWVQWTEPRWTYERGPVRRPFDGAGRDSLLVRPVASLLRDDVAWGEVAVTARGAESPLAWRP